MRVKAALLVVATVLVVLIAAVAYADVSKLFLLGDGVPIATLSPNAPNGGSLPNYDPERDEGPGLLIRRGGSGPDEKDPTKFQLWNLRLTGQALTVDSLTLWASSAGKSTPGQSNFIAYLMLCRPDCVVIDQQAAGVSGSAGWQKVVVPIHGDVNAYQAGDRLVVKLIVSPGSADDLWLAYGTQTYPAHLSTTNGSSTTTAPSGVSTTTAPPGTSTTIPTTTTTAGESSSTTVAGLLGGARGPDDPSDQPAGHGEGSSAEIGDFFGMDPKDDTIQFSPQKGLSAAYATVAENVDIYWQVAVALGALMAVLLIAGFDEEESESDPSRRILWHRRLNRI